MQHFTKIFFYDNVMIYKDILIKYAPPIDFNAKLKVK
jgi:hypothetical protein